MFEPEFDPVTINVFDQPWKPVVLKTFFSLFEAAQISGKKCMVYIKLTIIQGKTQNSRVKNTKLKQKTQGFGKIKNAVCRKSVEKKGCLN